MRKVWGKSYTTVGFVVFGLCLVPMFVLDNLRFWGTLWAFVAAITASAFVISYGVLANWRRNPDGSVNRSGQRLMTFTIVIAVVMWLVVLSRFGLIPMEWAPYLAYMIYTAVAFLMVWQLVQFVAAQRVTRRRVRARSEQ